MLGQFRQEIHATRQWAKAAAAIAVAHGFPRHAAIGPLFRGWTLAMQGQGVEGITQIRQGLVAYRDLGMAMEDPYFLALLAAAYVSAGQVQDGKAALSLELRAAISLSRLWQQQRKAQESHTLLADIFAWFTEGFDTPDLQEAKRLLQTCLKR